MKEITFNGLNKFNFTMAFIHLIQGIFILLLSSPTKGINPITISYLTFDPVLKKLYPATHTICNINLAFLVAMFFFLSAAAHIYIATFYRKHYEQNLAKGTNKIRWIEYPLSASVMMVGISLLSGILDLSSLIMIFFLDALMNLLGLAMERQNHNQSNVNWLTYILGCIAGIVPWIVFGIYIYGSHTYGAGTIPTFVYWIYVSIFIFFNSFAVNMFLQYKKIGPWKNYLYGERMYITLSLIAKSLLAWQVFAGTLRP